MMHGREKSDSAIVAGKPTNKAERSAAEPVEPRAEAKGNAGQQSTHRAQYRERVSKALACIRQHIAAVDTRGGSRMRESCTYGSERGARGNSRPYRDRLDKGLPAAQRRNGAALRRLGQARTLSRTDEVVPRLHERAAYLCDRPPLARSLRHVVGEQRRRLRSGQHDSRSRWRIRQTRRAHPAL